MFICMADTKWVYEASRVVNVLAIYSDDQSSNPAQY